MQPEMISTEGFGRRVT